MPLEDCLLLSAGAFEEQYSTGDFIFREDGTPQFFYKITEGEVKVNNYSDEGKELIQNMLSPGACFGESMLILGRPYPVNAIALTRCTVLKLGKENFLNLLKTDGAVSFELCTALSQKRDQPYYRNNGSHQRGTRQYGTVRASNSPYQATTGGAYRSLPRNHYTCCKKDGKRQGG